MASSSGLAPSWLDASLGGPSKPRASSRPGVAALGSGSGRASAGAGSDPRGGSDGRRDLGGSGASGPGRSTATGPYRPPMMSHSMGGSRGPGGGPGPRMEQERKREPAKPKKNAFDTQFPSLGQPAAQPGGGKPQGSAAWGVRGAASQGKPGQMGAGKMAAPAKPKLKMVNQSVSKVSRARPMTMAAPAPVRQQQKLQHQQQQVQQQQQQQQQQQPVAQLSGLQAPIRGSLHNRNAAAATASTAATAIAPTGGAAPGTAAEPSKPPPQMQLHTQTQPQTLTRQSSKPQTAGPAPTERFQPTQAQTSLARKIIKNRKAGGRSITDVGWMNDVINPSSSHSHASGSEAGVGPNEQSAQGDLDAASAFSGGLMDQLGLEGGLMDQIAGEYSPGSWETEERLLRQMGWTDGMMLDDDGDDGDDGLTEEEIKAFQELQVAQKRKDPPAVAAPVALAPPAWMTQPNPPLPTATNEDDSSDESSDDDA